MKHRNIVNKGSSYTAFSPTDGEIFLYEYDPVNDKLTTLTNPTVSKIGDAYSFTITVPNKDVYLLLKWGPIFDIIRVGEPDVTVFLTSHDTTITYNYKHIKADGTLLSEGTFTSLENGFYYHKPVSLEFSYFIVNNNGVSVLDLPYNVVNVSDTNNAPVVNGNFIDVGYAEFGFLGERHSYFDTTTGKWVNDSTAEAKAEDLAKAVAHKYNLNFSDRTASNWIGNYIAYFRTYDEEAKQFRLYVPSITPSNNINNFPLYSTDEYGNPFLRGVSILIKSGIDETEDGSIGLTIPFR